MVGMMSFKIDEECTSKQVAYQKLVDNGVLKFDSNKDIAWDLKKPCKDCPFRRDVTPHVGVLQKMELYLGQMVNGRFAHSCHKTDPRSDGWSGRYYGPVQHCAGALIFTRNIGEIQDLALWAAENKKFSFKKLSRKTEVFNDSEELIWKYKDYFSKK